MGEGGTFHQRVQPLRNLHVELSPFCLDGIGRHAKIGIELAFSCSDIEIISMHRAGHDLSDQGAILERAFLMRADGTDGIVVSKGIT